MGSMTVPPSGLVYFDTNPVIYSVEKNPTYWPLLEPVWQAAKAGTVEIVSSDLTLMETLVGPLKAGDTALAHAYERLFQQAQTRLLPITHVVLREAARLRGNQAQNSQRAAPCHCPRRKLRALHHQRRRLPKRGQFTGGNPG